MKIELIEEIKKEKPITIISIILSFLIIIAFLAFGFDNVTGALGKGRFIEECYKYTNSSSSNIKYIFGKCYFPEYKKIHSENIRTFKCIVAKTGEEC